jgi:hypothetical protein
LRGEALWKRKGRRKNLRQKIKGARFASLTQAEGVGPQEQREVVTDLIRHPYRSMLRYARRHVRRAELNVIRFGISFSPSDF